MSVLQARDITLAYDGVPVIAGVDLPVPPGQITALIGPNGCGKSTLLRGLARLLKPRAGAVYLDGAAISALPTKELARRLGILPQSPTAPEGLTVRDLVAQGRYPHQGWFQQWSREDEAVVARALDITGTTALAGRPLDTLSGGQRQRAWIAMALAQETPILLLDEPTTFLDIAHQLEVLHLLERLNREEGRTIVMVVHDLNHAARYAGHLVAMAEGRIVVAGPPREVLTPATLREVFAVEVDILTDRRTGAPICVPYGLCSTAAPNLGVAPGGERAHQPAVR